MILQYKACPRHANSPPLTTPGTIDSHSPAKTIITELQQLSLFIYPCG